MDNNLFDDLCSDSSSEHEKVRLIVLGSPEGIKDVMQSLHRLGYAKVGDWSRILPIPEKPGFMSILTRHRQRD
jgi:hypothetical protein